MNPVGLQSRVMKAIAILLLGALVGAPAGELRNGPLCLLLQGAHRDQQVAF